MFDPTLAAQIREWRGSPGYLVALLAGLQFRNGDFMPLRRLGVSEWHDLLSFSDPAHLTLLLANMPSDVLPRWVASRVQENLSDNTKRVERAKEIYAELAAVFQRANADHLVVKGFAQFPGYVKNLNLRMQSDIDIFCPPNTILYARDALLGIGYRESTHQRNVPVDHFPSMSRAGGWQWRGNSFDPEMPLSVELHYCLWNEKTSRLRLPEIDQFWYRRVKREIQGVSFPALDVVDSIAFCSLHVLRGVLRNEWIVHHVYELAYFLNSHARDEELWTNWASLHSRRLRSLESISFCLAKMWFGCEVSALVERHIRELPLRVQQWFHLFGSSPLKEMFAPNHHGVWLHAALMESTRAKSAVIRKGLLPGRIPPMEVADLNPTVDHQAGVRPRSPYRTMRYAAYAAVRAAYYYRILFSGLWSGIRWWFSQRKVGVVG